MSCILSPGEVLQINQLIKSNSSTPIEDLIPSIIDKALQGTGRELRDLLDNSNINILHKIVNYELSKLGDEFAIDKDKFSNLLSEEISIQENIEGSVGFGQTSNVKFLVEEEKNNQNHYAKFLQEPEFESPEKYWKMTPREIMDIYFDGAPALYNKADTIFLEKIYRYIGFDYTTGHLFEEDSIIIKEGIEDFKNDIALEKAELQDQIEQLKVMGPKAKQAIISDKVGTLQDAYIYMLMEDLIPHFMSKNFSGSLNYTEDGEYKFEHEAKHRTDWTFSGPEDSSTSFMVKPHLNTAPLLKKSGENIYTATGQYMSMTAVQNLISRNPHLNQIYNSSESIKESLKQVMRLDKDEAVNALYYRFYSDYPVTVELPSGETVEYYSLASVRDDETKPREVRRLASNIITNFESNFMNSKPTVYVSYKNGALEFINLGESYAGELSSTINSRLDKAILRGEINTSYSNNILSLTYNGKQIKFDISFTNIDGHKLTSDYPIKASLKQGSIIDALEMFGFNLGDRAQRFIDVYNSKFGKEPNAINSLVGSIGMMVHANSIGPKEGVKLLTNADSSLNESKVNTIVEQQQKANKSLMFPPAAIITSPMKSANIAYQDTFDLNVSTKISNFEGNTIPKNMMQNVISQFEYISKKVTDSKNPLFLDNAFLEENQIMKLEQFAYRDAYYSELYPEGISQSEMTPGQRAEFSIVGGYGTTVFENPNGGNQHMLMNIMVAADKSMQPDAYIKNLTSTGFIPKNKEGNLDTTALFSRYQKTEKPYWETLETKILEKYKNIYNIEASSLKELQDKLSEAKILYEDASKEDLPKGIYRSKKGKFLALRDDLIAFVEIHKDEKLLKSYLSRQRKKFAANLSSYKTLNINPDQDTTGLETSFTIPADLNKKVANRFGNIWADGKIYDPESKQINPLIDSYFFNHIISAGSMNQLLHQNVFQYKEGDTSKVFNEDGSINIAGLDLALTKSVNDQVKRTPAATSSFNRMILADDTVTSTRKLDKTSNVLVTNDIEVKGALLATGTFKAQESQDGAHYIHPLHALRMSHSFGDIKSPLKGEQIKNMVNSFNSELGTSQYHKLATHPMGIEWMRQSVGAKLDWNRVNELFLKGTGNWDSPVYIRYESEYPTGAVVDGEFNNLYEVFKKLKGTSNEYVFHDLLEIIHDYPETRHNYIGVLEFTTSIKSGDSHVNPNLYAVLDGSEEAVYSTVNNEFNGIQLNPNHTADEEHMKNGLSPITQMINALAAGGASTVDSQAVFDALNKLTQYNLKNEIEDFSPEKLRKYIAGLVIEASKKDSNSGRIVRQKMVKGKVNLNDPQIMDIALSQLNARLSKLGVSPKFNGGQFVVRSLADSYMIYDINLGSKTYSMPFQEMKTFLKNHPETEVGEPRNLNWTRYVDKETGKLDIHATTIYEMWGLLNDGKVTTLEGYNNLRKDHPEALPEVDSFNEAKIKIGTAFQSMLNSDNFEAIPGEVVLPNIFKETYGIEKGDSIAEIIDNPNYFGDPALHESFVKAMEGIDARIPGSGKQSAHKFRVVGFVEADYNVIGIPVESMLVKGEDLDIDKGNIQLQSIALQGDLKGHAYPYVTTAGINNPNGTILSKEDILNDPKYSEQLSEWEENYSKGDDWYQQGILNFITQKSGDILSNPRNMIEANTTVGTPRIDKLAENQPNVENFSSLSPAKTFVLGHQNAGGQKMVGFEANASKGYYALFHSNQQNINKNKIRLSWDSQANKNLPTAFRTKFTKYSKLGGPYFDVANAKHSIYSLYDQIDKSKLSEEELVRIEEIMNLTYQKNITEQEAHEVYSELVNAATDNAKDPKLGKLGIDELINNYVTVGVAIGIPIERIVGGIDKSKKAKTPQGLLMQKNVLEIINLSKSKNISINEAKKELYPDAKKIKDYPYDVQDFLTLGDYAQEFSFVANLLGVNGGIPNNKFDMFNMINKFENYFDKQDFGVDFKLWIEDSLYRQQKIKEYDTLKLKEGFLLNPLDIIANNPHYLGYFQTAKTAYDIATTSLPQFKQFLDVANIVSKKSPLLKDEDSDPESAYLNQNDDSAVNKDDFYSYSLNQNTFRKLEKFYNLHVVHKFFIDHLPIIKTNSGTYDLLSDLGKSKFVRNFGNIVNDLRGKYPNNKFIQSLREGTFIDFGGAPVHYIKPVDPKTQRPQDLDVAQQDLKNIAQQDLVPLYAYSILMGANVSGTPSFESMFSEDVTPLVKMFSDTRANFTLENPKRFLENAFYLIEDFSKPFSSLTEAHSGVLFKEFKIYNKDTGKYQYYRYIPNADNEGVEAKVVTGAYKNTVVSVSLNSSALDEKVEDNADGVIFTQYKKEEVYHPDASYPYNYNMDSKIKSVNKAIKKDAVVNVQANSGFKANLLADVVSRYNPEFKIVPAAEALDSRAKKIIVLRSDILNEEEIEKLKENKEQVVFIGRDSEIDISKVNLRDEDILNSTINTINKNITDKDALRRDPANTSYTSIEYTNKNTLSYKYINSTDAIILSINPNEYNSSIRKKLFGNNPDLINKGEKLIDKDGIQYTAMKSVKTSKTIISPLNEQVISFEGYQVNLKTRNGINKETFIPTEESLIRNGKILNEIDEYFSTEQELNDGVQTVEGKAFYDKFQKFNEDFNYGYAISPNQNKYLQDTTLIDEVSLYETLDDPESINTTYLQMLKSARGKVHVYSNRVSKIDRNINDPKIQYSKNTTNDWNKSVINREHDGHMLVYKTLKGFAVMANSRDLGVETFIINDGEIESGDLPNRFMGQKTFATEGKVYLNSDHITPDTPIYEYSKLWLRVLANKDNNLYNSIVSDAANTEKGLELKNENPDRSISDVGEEIFESYLTDFNPKNLTNNALATANAYINFINKTLESFDKKIKADMSITKAAQMLRNRPKAIPITYKVNDYHKLVLHELHGEGSLTGSLADLRQKLLDNGNLTQNCE